MPSLVYVDKTTCPETKKAQRYFALSSLYEVTVFSFLTLFLNECRKNLGWSSWMSSLSLFLPPFVASIAIFASSFFVSHHQSNLKAMRVLTASSFVLLLAFGIFGFLMPTGLDESGLVTNSLAYYGLFAFLLVFPSLLMGAHWSFLSFQTSTFADINHMEHTRFGHISVFGPLVSWIVSPLAGLVAESFFHSYRGYLLLFLCAAPLLILEFAFTFAFKSYDPASFHDEEDEKTSYRTLFANKTYLLYLISACLWVPSIWAGESLVSSYWTSLEGAGGALNAFNGFSYGCYLSLSYLLEFLFLYFNTKVGFGKKAIGAMNLSFVLLLFGAAGFGVLSYFFTVPPEDGLYLAIGIIALHSSKGMANGLYSSTNVCLLSHILGPKHRRKAVFLAPALYQFINAFLQMSYPFLNQARHIAFFVLSGLALVGLILSFVLDIPLLHPSKSKGTH